MLGRFYAVAGLALVLATAAAQAEPARLVNLRKLTNDGASIAPLFSPQDNKLLAFSGDKYQGLYLMRLDSFRALGGGQSGYVKEQLSGDQRAGFGFSWTGDGAGLVFRAQQADSGESAKLLNLQNRQITELSETADSVSVPVVSGDNVFFVKNAAPVRVRIGDPSRHQFGAFSSSSAGPPALLEKQGQVYLGDTPVSPETSQCWLPQMAPAGDKFSFECWEGLYVYHIPARHLYFLGPGSAAAWAADSRQLVYEQTQDDGHRITAADVFLINYDATGRQTLSQDIAEIVRRPSLSPDGRQLAVDIDGDLYLADIARGAP